MCKIAVLIVALTITACSTGKKTPQDLKQNHLQTMKKGKTEIKSADLLGCWTDSREENTGSQNINVYRPCSYKSFPISRFRFKMELKENGLCSYLYLAPNDGHHMKDGTWLFNEETRHLKILNTSKKVIKNFEITKVEKDILQLKN